MVRHSTSSRVLVSHTVVLQLLRLLTHSCFASLFSVPPLRTRTNSSDSPSASSSSPEVTLVAGSPRVLSTQLLLLVLISHPAVLVSSGAFHSTIFECLGACLAVAVNKQLSKDGVVVKNIGTACISEFLGTFFLVFTVGLNVIGGSP